MNKYDEELVALINADIDLLKNSINTKVVLRDAIVLNAFLRESGLTVGDTVRISGASADRLNKAYGCEAFEITGLEVEGSDVLLVVRAIGKLANSLSPARLNYSEFQWEKVAP